MGGPAARSGALTVGLGQNNCIGCHEIGGVHHLQGQEDAGSDAEIALAQRPAWQCGAPAAAVQCCLKRAAQQRMGGRGGRGNGGGRRLLLGPCIARGAGSPLPLLAHAAPHAQRKPGGRRDQHCQRD